MPSGNEWETQPRRVLSVACSKGSLAIPSTVSQTELFRRLTPPECTVNPLVKAFHSEPGWA